MEAPDPTRAAAIAIVDARATWNGPNSPELARGGDRPVTRVLAVLFPGDRPHVRGAGPARRRPGPVGPGVARGHRTHAGAAPRELPDGDRAASRRAARRGMATDALLDVHRDGSTEPGDLGSVGRQWREGTMTTDTLPVDGTNAHSTGDRVADAVGALRATADQVGERVAGRRRDGPRRCARERTHDPGDAGEQPTAVGRVLARPRPRSGHRSGAPRLIVAATLAPAILVVGMIIGRDRPADERA